LLEKLPLALAAAAVSVVTWQTQRSLGAMAPAGEWSLATRAANALVSVATYLRRALWPSDLAIYYPHPGDALGAGAVAGSALLVAALTALALVSWRRRPWLTVGWLWWLGMLVPVIGIVQVGAQAMADRYTYLPLTGLTLAVAWSAADWGRERPGRRRALAALGTAAVAALSVATAFQLRHWRDGRAAFEHALAVTRDNEMAHMGLGTLALEAGAPDEAVRHLERAVAIRPSFVDAHVNLGAARIAAGQPEAAFAHLERGLGLPPARRARVHAQLGLAYQRTGRPEPAIHHYREALALDPADPGGRAHLNLGVLMADRGRPDEALRLLDAAVRRGADDPELYAARAGVRSGAGDARGAVEDYRRALARPPDWPAVQNNLAWLLATDARVRDPAEALRIAEAASRATGGVHPQLLDTLAAAQFASGRAEAARATAARAVARARAAGQESLARQIEARARSYE
jgi:tetratricopeptide (TPR) repeat protein